MKWFFHEKKSPSSLNFKCSFCIYLVTLCVVSDVFFVVKKQNKEQSEGWHFLYQWALLLAPADTHPSCLLLAFAIEEIQSAAMSLLQ